MTTFTVALIGPDGAGKTTLGRHLERSLPIPAKYIYMGVNTEASNLLLPTTRVIRALKRSRGAVSAGGPPDLSHRQVEVRGVGRRILRGARSMLRLANRLAEEWFRQILVWYHLRRGRIVLFDRHFYSDYYAHDISTASRERSWSRQVHGFVLKYLYPKPDLVILLDAPAEVLWQRKQEGRFEALVRRREEYLRLRDVLQDLAIVDATQPEPAVVSQVARLILDRYEGRKAGR